MPYTVYPCTHSEQLFQAVYQNQVSFAWQPDFAASIFLPQPRLLFQNNALGEWFKVRLAQEQGFSIGLTVSLSQEVQEHYLRLFFPELGEEKRWAHADIISLLVYQLLENSNERDAYLPKSLKILLRQTAGTEVVDRSLWSFAQDIGQLFSRYDSYREILRDVLETPLSASPDASSELPNSAQNAEPWQQNLWREVQRWDSFYWHGRLIEEILAEKREPLDNAIEPLFIIGSGFLNAQQLTFYQYLSRFTQVCHFWLTPAQFPLELRRQAAAMLWGGTSYNTRQLGEGVGGLPQYLWLENSLHSAALLSHIPGIDWQPYSEGYPAPSSLLKWVQERLRVCADQGAVFSAEDSIAEIDDGSIRYFACSDKCREVEVLKDQILAYLDAYPDCKLNDIAVLAPDINEYQNFIQNIFRKSDVRLNCNFMDLNSSGSTSSEYISAFSKLLGFRRFALDECLQFLENPCVRAAKILAAKPVSFWRKVLGHGRLTQGRGDDASEQIAWQDAARRLIHDYLHDYDPANNQANDHRPAPDCEDSVHWEHWVRKISLNQEEAELLGEFLQTVLQLRKRITTLKNRRYTISEWVQILENLQDDFLCCHSEPHEKDRDILNVSLRNFLAIEESFPENKGSLRFPLSVIQSLLERKLEQNFSVKGRFLTQGITCASLQPYRSVPFRMICVLGLNEKDFPGSVLPSRFDICHELPQHLSRQAQAQHIFAELLISAGERLLLFYQNRDMTKGSEKNPSASLHELTYFIAKTLPKTLRRDEEQVWQELTEEHPLFPFDKSYFCAPEPLSAPADAGAHSGKLFSYSRSHYREFQALENSLILEENGVEAQPVSLQPAEHTFHFQDLLDVLYDAPAYFWKRYSGLDEEELELPLSGQFAQGHELLCKGLEPLNPDKWQQQLWNEMEYLLGVLRLESGELWKLLELEGCLGTDLFRGEQWHSLRRSLDVLKNQVARIDFWPGWDEFYRMKEYSFTVGGGATRSLFSENAALGHAPSGQSRGYGAFLFPALAAEFEGHHILLEAFIPRLWWKGSRILCWNKSPYRFPYKLYNLLQHKLLCGLARYPELAGVDELLQLEWLYGEGVKSACLSVVAEIAETDAFRPLEDYLWLVWRANHEPLPLTASFLEFAKKNMDRVLLENFRETAEESFIAELQVQLSEQWLSFREQGQAEQPDESYEFRHHPDFRCLSLQDSRFWLCLHELLSV
ncbi:MAG: exodeoxyribonuclease V subunit gamma [Spirochaetota bacterium]